MGRRGKRRLKIGKRKASSSSPAPPWVDLPRDITANILKRIDAGELLETVQRVCRTWRSVCMEPSMFQKMHLSVSMQCLSYQTMWRLAVDRSQGQLQDLSICTMGDALFLDYVAQRSPKLRCLTLYGCTVTGEDVVEALKKFPLLEVLHLFFIPFSGECVEQVSRFCPLLKSFTLHREGRVYFWDESCDAEAMAIAKTMPGLRHLCIFANQLCNEALVAILDGCVQLESLDLSLCSNVDLSGDLGERCSRQMKHLYTSEHSLNVFGKGCDGCRVFSEYFVCWG